MNPFFDLLANWEPGWGFAWFMCGAELLVGAYLGFRLWRDEQKARRNLQEVKK